MAPLRATRFLQRFLPKFLLVLIPLFAAAKIVPQHLGEQIALTSEFDSEVDNGLHEAVDFESGYSTTEFPYLDYQTTSAFEDESSIEETTQEIVQEYTKIVDKVVAGHLKLRKERDSENKSLTDLFYETNSVEELDMQHCERRLRNDDLWQHITFRRHNVYLSTWDSDNTVVDPLTGKESKKTFTWQEAHDLCRSHCKELLTLDTFERVPFVSIIINSEGLQGFWTSGRRCDFPGCRNRNDVHENGWFWITNGVEIGNSYKAKSPKKPPFKWAETGVGRSQPDNAEFAIRGVNESCLALRRKVDRDMLKLHDLPCYHKLHVMCEEPLRLNDLRN